MKLLLLVFAVVVGRCSSRPDASTSITYQTSDGVNPPILVQKIEPLYSDDALKAKYQRIVRISLVVGLNGEPENLEVVQVAGLGLDEKAVEAVSQWRFTPGTKEGHVVRVSASVEANFRLRGWRVTRLESTPLRMCLPLYSG